MSDIEYPKSLQWAVIESKLMDDSEFRKQIDEYRCSPIRLLDYMNRASKADDALLLYRASEGYTKTVNLGRMGFVANV